MSDARFSAITRRFQGQVSLDRLFPAHRRSLRLGVVAAFAVLAMQVPAGLAQTPVSEATPVTPVSQVTEDGPHPAHIHAGTCDALGQVVLPLESVGYAEEEGEFVGPESAHAVKFSRTFVDMPLDEIVAGGHTINVHQSDEEIGVYIACGDIGGVITEEGGRSHLIIGLGELNDSGHTGVVWLGEDGDQTEVVIQLIEPDEMD